MSPMVQQQHQQHHMSSNNSSSHRPGQQGPLPPMSSHGMFMGMGFNGPEMGASPYYNNGGQNWGNNWGQQQQHQQQHQQQVFQQNSQQQQQQQQQEDNSQGGSNDSFNLDDLSCEPFGGTEGSDLNVRMVHENCFL